MQQGLIFRYQDQKANPDRLECIVGGNVLNFLYQFSDQSKKTGKKVML